MQENARHALETLIRDRRESSAGLSRLLGRNSAYIQQYIKRGTPRTLEQQDRQTLARYFGVSETLLGAPEQGEASGGIVEVPCLAVEASAGPGSLIDREASIGTYVFDERWLRALCGGKPKDLSIIKVTGDSMAPTLTDGDDVLVDRSDASDRLRDGLYILRRDETLMVKRIALAPTSGTLIISSDNPAYPSWRDCPTDSVTVLGRVVWAGRKFG